jgi:glycosyltransferase involved in cell wall biosynthesis
MASWNGRRQWFVDFVTSRFDQKTAAALREADGAVFCYEDSALATFQRAQSLGIARIYDLPTLHYRELQRIFAHETGKHPELVPYFQSLHEPAAKLDRKDQELMSADVIVVASTLVRRSIEDFLKPKAQFVVVPYGSDTSRGARTWTRDDEKGPLRLFFAGVLKPGKGLHTLFEALSRLSPAQYHLSLAGRWIPGFREWLDKRYSVKYEWLGQLTHDAVYGACRRSHVFVFPSLAEGFGLVILEAMASGIPVVASDHTAGPDVIDEGVDGWVVPAGDSGALSSCLARIMDQRADLPEFGRAARRKAETLDWSKYRKQLRENVFAALAQNGAHGNLDSRCCAHYSQSNNSLSRICDV